MAKNNALKKCYIKSCTCYYFDDIIYIHNLDLDFDNILLDEISYENI